MSRNPAQKKFRVSTSPKGPARPRNTHPPPTRQEMAMDGPFPEFACMPIIATTTCIVKVCALDKKCLGRGQSLGISYFNWAKDFVRNGFSRLSAAFLSITDFLIFCPISKKFLDFQNCGFRTSGGHFRTLHVKLWLFHEKSANLVATLPQSGKFLSETLIA